MNNLESIAEKLKNRKELELEAILKISGSEAIEKNKYNVTIANDKTSASSFIFKPLFKSKIDTEELQKAINVEVKELKPNLPKEIKNLVPKPLYDAEATASAQLRVQVLELNNTVSDLNATISDLNIQIENEINNRLTIEQTNDVLVNQLNTLIGTIEDFSKQIATSLQKSVDESILRASLQSQNTGFKAQIKALIKQIDSLNSIIEGLQAQLGAVQQQQAIQQSTANVALASGAEVVNKVVAVKINPAKENPNYPDINGKINNKTEDSAWIAGSTLDITNNDTKDVQIEIRATFAPNQRWFSIPKSSFTIAAGQNDKVGLTITPGGCSFDKRDKSVEHMGTLKIKVKRLADNTEETKEYKTRIGIMHPKSYD